MRPARVVSYAKLTRCAASSFSRVNMTRPAERATLSGENAERPRAIVSASTNSVTPKAPLSSVGAVVDLPAPLGPARTTTPGGLPRGGFGRRACFTLRPLSRRRRQRERPVLPLVRPRNPTEPHNRMATTKPFDTLRTERGPPWRWERDLSLDTCFALLGIIGVLSATLTLGAPILSRRRAKYTNPPKDQCLLLPSAPGLELPLARFRLVTRRELLRPHELHGQPTSGVSTTLPLGVFSHASCQIVSMPDIERSIRTFQNVRIEWLHRLSLIRSIPSSAKRVSRGAPNPQIK